MLFNRLANTGTRSDVAVQRGNGAASRPQKVNLHGPDEKEEKHDLQAYDPVQHSHVCAVLLIAKIRFHNHLARQESRGRDPQPTHVRDRDRDA